MTTIKICGLTRPEDAAAAAELGADLLGMVFAAASPRRLDLARAAAIARASEGAVRVGVFKHEPLAEVVATVERARLSFVQLQRPVSEQDVRALPVPVIAAIRRGADAAAMPGEVLSRLRAVLLDDSEGAGRRSGWASLGLAERPQVPANVALFVAGGLDETCVGDAIRRLRPDGVDVATGVESSLGIKDRGRMERFIAAVREADRAAH
ncbi:MAG TPA: phosphoribosylanthranilate isomerase [Thermoanaerobaculia bacterium]